MRNDAEHYAACHFCHENRYIYQMQNPCCRARFLVNQPNLEARRAWLERWARELDEKTITTIMNLTRELWEAKRQS